MSRNVVDACLIHTARSEKGLILIPSRRQIEYNGGYSNGWTTQGFTKYIRERDPKRLIVLERDHGGPGQGKDKDDGLDSLAVDCQHFDIIHIDPWVTAKTLEEGCRLTKELIEYCYVINPSIQYEIGTEEAIFPYGVSELEYIISYLKNNLSSKAFSNIAYIVVQCGTSLHSNTNTGTFDSARLMGMLKVCDKYGLLSKEHNGDYISSSLLAYKLALGLNCINIAPEFGQIETQTIVDSIHGNAALMGAFYRICFDSKRWVKWFRPGIVPSQEELINVCGHYVLSDPVFLSTVKAHLRLDIDRLISDNMVAKLHQLYGLTP